MSGDKNKQHFAVFELELKKKKIIKMNGDV